MLKIFFTFILNYIQVFHSLLLKELSFIFLFIFEYLFNT